MFIKVMEWLSKNKDLSLHHRGSVVDNVDPKKLGRVKLSIPERLVSIPTENLPWIAPLNPYGLGGSASTSGFSVPEIGSELVVIFPFDSIYFGFYIGYWQSSETHQSDFDTDYPETYGFKDSTDSFIKVNKLSGDTEINHMSGTNIKIDIDGNVTIVVPGSVNEQIGVDEVKLTAENKSESVGKDRTTSIGANDNETVEGNRKEDTKGNLTESVTGDMNGTVTGNRSETISGNKTENVTGNKTITINGDKIVTVSGSQTITVTGAKTEESSAKNTIKGATVDIDDGSGATIPCNNFRVCPILGIPHGLNPNVKVPA